MAGPNTSNSPFSTALDFVKQGVDAVQQTVQVVLSNTNVNQACKMMGNASLATAQQFVNGNLPSADRLLSDLIVSDPMGKIMQGDKSSSQDQAQAQAIKARASEVMARVASGSVSEGDLASLNMDIYGKESYFASGYAENAVAEGQRYLGKRTLSEQTGRDYKADTRNYKDEDELRQDINNSQRTSKSSVISV